MAMIRPPGNSGSQSSYQQLRHSLPAPAGRTSRKQSTISSQPVGFESIFAVEERSFQDPATGAFITIREGTSYVLACGCVVSAPYEIMACPYCGRQPRKGQWKGLRLVCRTHGICARCARAQEIAANGGGPIRKLLRLLLTVLLWPLFDRIDEDED